MATPHNIQVEKKGDKLVIIVDVSKDKLANAPLSSTGKSRLVASSGGWQSVDGNGLAYSLNVNTK